MKSYLEASGLWEAVTSEIQSLSENPTVAEIRNYNEEARTRSKAKTCIHSEVSDVVFTRIINCETAKEAWDTLREAFHGNERTRQMQILTLRREFEMLRMKDNETIKEYFDRLLIVVNKICLLREDLPDSRVVEKVLVSLPERFEAKISSLEDSRNLKEISLTELMNSLQNQEQRRMLREETKIEGAFQAKEKIPSGSKSKKKNWKNKKNDEAGKGEKETYPPCQHCKKKSHPHWRCWWRPEVVCRSCNQKGHVEKVCKRKQQGAQIAQESEDEKEEHLFVATCFVKNVTSKAWLIDSGCTHHMTYDRDMFVKLDETHHSKVRIGNSDCIDVKGIGDIGIETVSSTRIISDVLYVPEIDQHLLSVGQLLEKDYTVIFKDKMCEVLDKSGTKLLTVKMKGKSFLANMQTDVAYTSAANTGQLWHKRLGHFHYTALNQMHKNELVQNLPYIEEREEIC